MTVGKRVYLKCGLEVMVQFKTISVSNTADVMKQLRHEPPVSQPKDQIVGPICGQGPGRRQPDPPCLLDLCGEGDVLVTPRIGGATKEASIRSSVACAEAIDDYFSGCTPKFIVPKLWDLI